MTTERELLREARDALDAIANLREEARWDLAKRIDTYLATPEHPAVQGSEPSFEAIRDAIAVRMGGHSISVYDAEAWANFLELLRQVKASECALPAPAPSGAAKVLERETRRVYKADAEEYRSYITARFEKANSG